MSGIVSSTDMLSLFMAGMAAFAVGMYVVLDGFDLGLGLLFPFARDHAQRDQMMNSIAPFWDGNETWLVFGGAILLSAFPLAFAIIMPAVYLPIIVMLLGLIFRGVAFEFRFRHHPRVAVWDLAFAGGSMVATFAQGVVLGAFVQGIRAEAGHYAGGPWDWFTPFSALTGVGLLCGYALLGNTWLFWRAHGDLQERARAWMPLLLVAMLAAIGVVSVWTPLMSPSIAARWFDFPRALAFTPVPVLTAVCALGAYRAIKRPRSFFPQLHRPGHQHLSSAAAAFDHAVRGGCVCCVALVSGAGNRGARAADPAAHLVQLPGVSRQGRRRRGLRARVSPWRRGAGRQPSIDGASGETPCASAASSCARRARRYAGRCCSRDQYAWTGSGYLLFR
jgi:cytochrome d ubiquinol oxidase subunit II